MLSFSSYTGYTVGEVNELADGKLAAVLDSYIKYVVAGGGVAESVDDGLRLLRGRSLLLGGVPGVESDAVLCRQCGGDSLVGCGRRDGGYDERSDDADAGGSSGDNADGERGSGHECGFGVEGQSGGSGGPCFDHGGGESVADCVAEAVLPREFVESGSVVVQGPSRGKNYESNKKKRIQRKSRAKELRMAGSWRNGPGGLGNVGSLSDAGSTRSDGSGSESGIDQNVPTFMEFVEKKAVDEVVDQRAVDLEARMADDSAEKSARRTLNEKWAVENRLAKLKAEQAIKLLELKDLDLEAKKQASYTRMLNERNLVHMEKAHQYLKSTGNVPGFAQTVLSDEGLTDGPSNPGECTISPDSSASMKEFRELVKKCADLEAKLEQFHKMTKIHPDYIELYKKQTWTINSENIRILDEMYPQGHALNPIPDYENYDAPTHGELIVGRDEEYFPY